MQVASTVSAARSWRQFQILMAAVVIGVCAAATPGTAQIRQARIALDFAFVAAGREMPPGAYTFEADLGRILVRPQSGTSTPVLMAVVTRLGRHDTDAEPELIFDRVDGKLHLSEVWLPGADGYSLLSTTSDHDHRVHAGRKPRK